MLLPLPQALLAFLWGGCLSDLVVSTVDQAIKNSQFRPVAVEGFACQHDAVLVHDADADNIPETDDSDEVRFMALVWVYSAIRLTPQVFPTISFASRCIDFLIALIA